MKEIVLSIDDDAYRRVEGIANARKISLSALVEELVESVANDAQPTSDDINNLFAALDKGCNTEPHSMKQWQAWDSELPPYQAMRFTSSRTTRRTTSSIDSRWWLMYSRNALLISV
jgi:hypothetical protein